MRIEVKKRYLEIDGVPKFIFGGDLAYCRVRREDWELRIMQMKSAGLNTVAFYVPWIYHETSDGVFNFEGERDIGAFIDLIGKHDMYCIFRMGPFVHGEFKNGGLPQFIVDKFGRKVRTNDSGYLHYAIRWYDELLAIIKERTVKDGGPIIMLQLENELGSAGCKGDDLPRGSDDAVANSEHLLFYYRYIRSKGFDLPLIDINNIPDKEKTMENLVDTGGCYPVNCFSSDGDLGLFSTEWAQNAVRPKITIETGGGMFIRYYDTPAYRNTNGFQGPMVAPKMIELAVWKHIAEGCSGVNLYIFCDGQNPENCGESMLPVCDMNYQAPLTLTGKMRKSYLKLKRIGWFLRSFEQELLKSEPNDIWAKVVSCGTDFPGTNKVTNDLFEGYDSARPAGGETPALYPVHPVHSLSRVTRGLNLSESNFLFIRNIFNAKSQWLRDVKVSVVPFRLASEVYHEYPKKTQMELVPDSFKVMPFFIRICPGCFIEYSTAQLLDRRDFNGKTQVILYNSQEEMSEIKLALDGDKKCFKSTGFLVLDESPCAVTLIGKAQRSPLIFETDKLRLILLDTENAEQLWDIGDCAAICTDYIYGNQNDGIICRSHGGFFHLEMFSPQSWNFDSGLENAVSTFNPDWGIYTLDGEIPTPELPFKIHREYQGNDLHFFLTWENFSLHDNLHDVIAEVSYDGSFAKGFYEDKLISDHAYGRFMDWEVSLKNILKNNSSGTIELVCYDTMRADIKLNPFLESKITFGK